MRTPLPPPKPLYVETPCPWCKKELGAGEMIVLVDKRGLVHARCETLKAKETN
jgi:hypothetical protein